MILLVLQAVLFERLTSFYGSQEKDWESRVLATIILLGANTLVFCFTTADSSLIYRLGVVPSLVGSEVFRLFSAMFVHAGVLHLVSNMVALFYCGERLEERIGHFRFLFSYLVCGLAGNVSVLFFAGPTSVSVGASGAIIGLMGMLFVQMIKTEDWKGFAVIGQNLAINVYLTFSDASISVSGHLGGLVCGFLLGMVLSPDVVDEKKDRRSLSPVIVLVMLAVLLVIGAAVYSAMASKTIIVKNRSIGPNLIPIN